VVEKVETKLNTLRFESPKKKHSIFFYFGLFFLILILIGLIILGIGYFFPNYTYNGTVVDVYGNPVSEVSVTGLHGESAVTNEFGYFSFKSGFVGKSTINFKKSGFVPTHKSVEFGNDLFLDVLLFNSEAFQSIDLTQDTNVEMKRAGLNLEKDSLVLKGTNIFATSANVSLTPFDPTNEEEVQAFPGEFEGVALTGEVIPIESFGFAKVQLKDDNETALDLAPGKTAELIIPISENQRQISPDSIPLWNFDEKLGTWVEKGSAIKFCSETECYYKGKITTIASWWNADKGFFANLINLISKLGGALLNGILNPWSALSGILSAELNLAGQIWAGMVAGIQDAFNSAKEAAQARAQGMVDKARDMINSGAYNGKFTLNPTSDGSLDLTYGGELNTLTDLANCARDLEGLFPDATPAEIARIMRNSTDYGQWGNSNIVNQPLGNMLFGGGDLQHSVRLRSSDGSLFLSHNGGELTHNGVPFDGVHTLIGMDSVGSPVAGVLSNVPGSPFLNISKYQGVTDFVDAFWSDSLGPANPSDLRGNSLGTAANPTRAGSVSGGLDYAANNFNSTTARLTLTKVQYTIRFTMALRLVQYLLEVF